MALGSAFAAQPSLEPPKLRLGDAVEPSRYSVELTLVPGSDSFQGVVDIHIDVRTPSQIIWLNATRLEISKASFQPETGGAENASVAPGGSDYVGFTFRSSSYWQGHFAYRLQRQDQPEQQFRRFSAKGSWTVVRL